jgi:pilus assembly protein CpaF
MVEKVQLTNGKEISYLELLDTTQDFLKSNYSAEYTALLDKTDIDAEKGMVDLISRSMIRIGYFSSTDEHLKELSIRLFGDMSGLSILAKYLNHLEDDYADLEEINGNAWNSIVLKHTGGRTEFKEDSFLSPQHSVDIIRQIVEKNGGTLDDSTPAVTSDIGPNIRITALISPIVPKNSGAIFSIRITRPHNIDKEKLVSSGTASEENISFFKMCVNYGVPCVVSGAQYSGKTTMINYLLSLMPNEVRIYLDEEGSREIDAVLFDEDGRMVNQVIPCLTRPDKKNDERNFDATRLLQFALRFDSDVIVPQEIRDEAAINAVECARTAALVLTSIHAKSAKGTYKRIVTLMQLKSNQREDSLMGLAVEAFPIVIHMTRGKDGQPRVMEILEGEAYTHDKGLISRTLYRFAVEDNIRQSDGSIKVIGQFERVRGISENLKSYLLDQGAPKKLVEQYAKEV